MKTIHLCNVNEFADPDAKGFIIEPQLGGIKVIIVKYNGRYYAYKNSCPHTLGPLDWMPGNFLDQDKKFILCATHGAVFKIDDGLCIHGPCVGQYLQQIPFKVLDNTLAIEC